MDSHHFYANIVNFELFFDFTMKSYFSTFESAFHFLPKFFLNFILLYVTRSHNYEVVQHLTKSSTRSSHFPIVKEHVPQSADYGGKWKTTWFDGKPQLSFGLELVSQLFFSSIIHHLKREIRVMKRVWSRAMKSGYERRASMFSKAN